MHRPGVELAISRSQVRRPNHHTTKPDVDGDDGCVGLLLTATSLEGVAVNGTLVRFAQRNEHHDSKQPLLVVFTEQNLITPPHTGNHTGACLRCHDNQLARPQRHSLESRRLGWPACIQSL